MKHIPKTKTIDCDILSFDEAFRLSQKPNDAYDINKWLYVPPFYAEYRYVLGTKGDGPCARGDGPCTAGDDPCAAGDGPCAAGDGPCAAGDGPSAAGDGPCAAGDGPQLGIRVQGLGTSAGKTVCERNTNPYSLVPSPSNADGPCAAGDDPCAAGDGPLIVVGVNPSTAAPDALDPTLKSAERIAHYNCYDSFWMMNVYPQRATDPDDMERERNAFLEEQNMAALKKLLELSPTKDVWCAWGNIIDKRKFLKDCVQNIVDTGNKLGANWLQAEKTCKSGNPHHPLYLKSETKLIPFEP